MVMQLEENLKQIGFSIPDQDSHIASTFREQGISVDGPGVGLWEKKGGLLRSSEYVAVDRSVREGGVFDILYVKIPPVILGVILEYVGKRYIGNYYEGKFDRNTGEPMNDDTIEILKQLYS